MKKLIHVLLEAPWFSTESQAEPGRFLVEAVCLDAYTQGDCDQPSYIIAEIDIDEEPKRLAHQIAVEHNAGLEDPVAFAKDLLRTHGYLLDLWSVDDVQSVRPELSEAQCLEVLHLVEKRQDASQGINWDTLEAAAGDLFGPGEDE